METDPRIPKKPETKGDFTPLSQWLGKPSDESAKPPSRSAQPPATKAQSENRDATCRSTIEVERNGSTITRIHITCSCGDRHSIELHELPQMNAEDSSPTPGASPE